MINEIEFEAACKAAGLLRLTTSKTPTWVLESRDEGILLQAGMLHTFWVVDDERVYDQPASMKVQQIYDAFSEKKSSKQEIKQEVREDVIKQEKETKQEDKTEQISSTTMIPEVVTLPLLEKWKQMSTFERMFLFQKTAKEYIKERKGPSGLTIKYVTGNIMFQEANIAFLYGWESKINDIYTSDKSVAVAGSITVTIDGIKVTRSCVGYETISSQMDVNLAIKSAHTDMIKKGLSLFGFNNDVYKGGDI